MRPSQQLISALRRAADRIEDPNSTYMWNQAEHCNCGILAQGLLGLNPVEIHALTAKTGHNVWSNMCECAETCAMTGEPVPAIIAMLLDAGLTTQDIVSLENLSSVTVRERAGLPCNFPYQNLDTGKPCYGDFRVPPAVVSYLRAWASILEEQLLQEQKNLRQCGTPYRDCAPDHGSECATGKPVIGAKNSGPLPHSPSPMAELAKECVHMWCGKQCLYCCAVQPVEGVAV